MEAYADFIPASKGGTALTESSVKNLFTSLSLNDGVLWDTVAIAVDKCNKTKRPVKDVLVARGVFPIDEEASHFEVDPKLKAMPPPDSRNGVKINYHKYSPYVIVRKEQVLAVLKDGVKGVSGRTIHGKDVPYTSVQRKTVEGGKNTRTEDNKIISDVDGLFVVSGSVLNVETVLVVKGAVGYATGDINFPSDVVLQGSVNDGFKINSGGSLTVKETLDATDIIVRNNLQISGGMIGRGRAFVKVSGDINARFIQNCRVACKQTVTVANEVVNSTIYTMQGLSVSDNGIIMGGEIFAFNYVHAGKIGKESGVPIKLHVGTDWTISQDIENNENMMRMISAKLEKISSYLQTSDLDEEKSAKIKEMQGRLETEFEKCVQKASDFEQRFVVDKKSFVECPGVIVTGTIIEICRVEFVVSSPLRNVKLILNTETGCVVPVQRK
jgi:uncharacterized protein (DUF342 family)